MVYLYESKNNKIVHCDLGKLIFATTNSISFERESDRYEGFEIQTDCDQIKNKKENIHKYIQLAVKEEQKCQIHKIEESRFEKNYVVSEFIRNHIYIT